MADRILDRNDVYSLLKEAISEYSDLQRSADMEIFAIEMEVAPGKTDSADPALLDEFKKTFPDKVTLSEALTLAADYVERELVALRHVDAANVVVDELRAAAANPGTMSDILQRVVLRKGGRGSKNARAYFKGCLSLLWPRRTTYHRAAVLTKDEAAEHDTHFSIRGGDGDLGNAHAAKRRGRRRQRSVRLHCSVKLSDKRVVF